jgi:hypothetical protein
VPPVPAAFRRTGIRLLGHPAPAGALRLPHGRSTESAPDPIGVATLPAREIRPGRVPSILRGCGAHAAGTGNPAVAGRLTAAHPCTQVLLPPPRAWDNERRQATHAEAGTDTRARARNHVTGINRPPQRIHSPRGPSCRTPTTPSSSIPAALTHLTQSDPCELQDSEARRPAARALGDRGAAPRPRPTPPSGSASGEPDITTERRGVRHERGTEVLMRR